MRSTSTPPAHNKFFVILLNLFVLESIKKSVIGEILFLNTVYAWLPLVDMLGKSEVEILPLDAMHQLELTTAGLQ